MVKINKKGQQGIEYLMVFAVVIIVVMVFLAPGGGQKGLMEGRIERTLNRVVLGIQDMANSTYYNVYVGTGGSPTACGGCPPPGCGFVAGVGDARYRWECISLTCTQVVDEICHSNCDGLFCDTSSCLTGDTLITLFDKTKKPIKDLKVGDDVLSYDIAKDKFIKGSIRKVHEHTREGYYVIELASGDKIKMTDEHPVLVKNEAYQGWASMAPDKSLSYGVSAKKLMQDDQVFQSGGGWVDIRRIKFVKKEIIVYNISAIDNAITYFAEDTLMRIYSDQ